MKAEVNFMLRELEQDEAENKERQYSAEKIWNAITKCISRRVKIDKDGIFNDPKWPHLWDG